MAATTIPTPDDPVRVLIIDDDIKLAKTIVESLERKGYDCTLANSGQAGAKAIENDEFDVILTDLRMTDVDGLSIVKKVREHLPEGEVAVITGHNDVRTAQEAMKLGAAHYLMKPIDLSELRAIVEKSSQKVRLSKANKQLRQQLDERFGFEGVVGTGAKMQRVLQLLRAFSQAPAPVLVLGDNGTGKELAAKALHTNSPRRTKPFVAMNCAALNENLLDDEMFGHDAGAFTGADKTRKGRFEFANHGTLFLDEIGDMPLSLQAKLLRVLENGEVIRIGSNEAIKVDVRIIAATNRNLEKMVEEQKFRRDLYQRLKVGVIRLPALRERTEDIPILANHLLQELAKRYQREVPVLHESVRKAFLMYAWPGNVRELKNLLESMLIVDMDNVLSQDDLPEDAGPASLIGTPWPTQPHANNTQGLDALIGQPLEEVERFYIEKALALTEGNREEAAKMLRIGERTLYRKLQEWKKEETVTVETSS